MYDDLIDSIWEHSGYYKEDYDIVPWGKRDSILMCSSLFRNHPLHFANQEKYCNSNNPNNYLPWSYDHDYYCMHCENMGYDSTTNKPCNSCWSKFTTIVPPRSLKKLVKIIEDQFKRPKENIVQMPAKLAIVVRCPIWFTPLFTSNNLVVFGGKLYQKNKLLYKTIERTDIEYSHQSNNLTVSKHSNLGYFCLNILLIAWDPELIDRKDVLDNLIEIPPEMIVKFRHCKSIAMRDTYFDQVGIVCKKCRGSGTLYQFFHPKENNCTKPVMTCNRCHGWGRVKTNGESLIGDDNVYRPV